MSRLSSQSPPASLLNETVNEWHAPQSLSRPHFVGAYRNRFSRQLQWCLRCCSVAIRYSGPHSRLDSPRLFGVRS
jgi:hypothetical protein